VGAAGVAGELSAGFSQLNNFFNKDMSELSFDSGTGFLRLPEKEGQPARSV
jgi:hypothetical protein